MTDKDIIRTEIERLRQKVMGVNTNFAEGQKMVLTELLSFIRLMHLQTASETEIANDIVREVSTYPNITEYEAMYSCAIKGIRCQREQMLHQALDAEVTHGKSLTIPSLGYFLDKNGLDFGDKVKVIIIKEK